MLEEWIKLFEKKCKIEDLKSDLSKTFIELSINDLDINDQEKLLLTKYVDGEINLEEYKLIRDSVILDLLKVDRKKLEEDEVKIKVKEALVSYFLLYYFYKEENNLYKYILYNTNYKYFNSLVLKIIELLINSKVEKTRFRAEIEFESGNSYSGRSGRLVSHITHETNIKGDVDIEYSKIGSIENICFGILRENDNFYELNVKDIRVSNRSDQIYVEATIEENYNSNIVWEAIEDEAYIEVEIQYFTTIFSWEEYLIESLKLYNQNNYKLAFLQSMFSLDSFIESSIFQLKHIMINQITDWIFNNSVKEEVKDLVKFLVSVDFSRGQMINKEIIDSAYFIKKISNDTRNLVNEKFVDLMNINYYLHSKKIKNLFSEEENKFLIERKKRLNYMMDIRNDLSHGDVIEENIDFELLYKEILSIFIYIIMEFKNKNNQKLINSFN
ncbi:hypothetical protein [Peptoniphilus phoceensis]|uniref:hypothetical protein n=1 Tax=Peptoniphilus phoceensis TaxID=1720298 RepID=UPI000781E32A|nr:hypothetical protein [Peptoniphilus phoceensis]